MLLNARYDVTDTRVTADERQRYAVEAEKNYIKAYHIDKFYSTNALNYGNLLGGSL